VLSGFAVQNGVYLTREQFQCVVTAGADDEDFGVLVHALNRPVQDIVILDAVGAGVIAEHEFLLGCGGSGKKLF
jgi:hypothetical protein